MTAAVIPASQVGLTFQESASTAIGLRGNLLETVRNNAPRIVGALKLAGDITAGLTLNPFLMAYTAFAVVSRVILMVYGTKENQKKLAAEYGENASKHIVGDSWRDTLGKITKPRQYPIEASAGFSMVADAFGIAYGASELLAGKAGLTPFILGMFSLWSYGNILFGKEKDKTDLKENAKGQPTSLPFTQSESKPVGVTGWIKSLTKNNPVLVSSLLQVAVTGGMLVGGLMEGMPFAYNVAASIFLTASIIQALFVRKNEFNIEGAQNANFEDRLAQQRRTPAAGAHIP